MFVSRFFNIFIINLCLFTPPFPFLGRLITSSRMFTLNMRFEAGRGCGCVGAVGTGIPKHGSCVGSLVSLQVFCKRHLTLHRVGALETAVRVLLGVFHNVSLERRYGIGRVIAVIAGVLGIHLLVDHAEGKALPVLRLVSRVCLQVAFVCAPASSAVVTVRTLV